MAAFPTHPTHPHLRMDGISIEGDADGVNVELLIAACVERSWHRLLDAACASPVMSASDASAGCVGWIGGGGIGDGWAASSDLRHARSVVRSVLEMAERVDVGIGTAVVRRDVCAATLYCVLGRLSVGEVASMALCDVASPRLARAFGEVYYMLTREIGRAHV